VSTPNGTGSPDATGTVLVVEETTVCTVVEDEVLVVVEDPVDPQAVATTRSATRQWVRALGLLQFTTRVYTMTTAELRTFSRGNMSAALSDHDAIRQVAARYARGVDRLDGDLMKSAYWPEATDDHGVFVGNAMAFCDRVIDSHQRFTGTMHCVMNHAIEVNGSTASGEIYNDTYVFRTDNGVDHIDTWFGRYLDQYENRNGEWRIIERICVHENTTSQSIDTHMPIDAAKFRHGSIDRGTATPLGY
jgi:hypothetical protein